MKWIDLYNFKFRYNYKKGQKVTWNKKIFKACPFDIDETKVVDEAPRQTKDFVGIEGRRPWFNWWELMPMSITKKPLYWVKFYSWYWIRYKRYQRQVDKVEMGG